VPRRYWFGWNKEGIGISNHFEEELKTVKYE
jgi:hypothetical protein